MALISSTSSISTHPVITDTPLNIASLPGEMCDHIFRNTDLATSISLASVCWQFRAIIIPGIIQSGRQKECCAKAAELGYLHLLKWARTNGLPWDARTFAWAAKSGNIEPLEWLLEKGCPFNELTFAHAAREGNIEALKRLLEKSCPWDPWTFAWAARGGSIKTLEWLDANGCPRDAWTLAFAIRSGRIDVLEWLTNRHFPTHYSTMLWSTGEGASGDGLAVFDSSCPWDSDKTRFAWSGDGAVNLTILKWLKDNGHSCPCGKRTCALAAKAGDVKTLEWLKDNGCYWQDKETVYSAARAGQIEVLKWLKANDYPRDHWSLIWLIYFGATIEALEWIRVNIGLPLNAKIFAQAACSGRIDILEWLKAKGCPGDETASVGANLRLEIIEWLRKNEYPVAHDWYKHIVVIAMIGSAILDTTSFPS